MRTRPILTALALTAVSLSCGRATKLQAQPVAQVPLVGCASDGQVGPASAPKGGSKTFPIVPVLAARLAYYKSAYGFGMLAPRGWHCFSTYGSAGSSLFITPDAIGRNTLFSTDWKGFSDRAIEVSVADGDTSGRFEVARVIARMFPDHSDFVDSVIAEHIEPAEDFPRGPFPTDKLTRRVADIAEFETPPNADGLGTASRLRKNSSSIRGVVMLFGEEPSLVHASVRVSERDRDLIDAMLRELESEVAKSGGEQ